jgi:hypothetical protein
LPSAGVLPILPAARPKNRKSNTDVPAARFPIHPGPGPFLVHGFYRECCQTEKQGIGPGAREQEGRNKSTRPLEKKITEEACLVCRALNSYTKQQFRVGVVHAPPDSHPLA